MIKLGDIRYSQQHERPVPEDPACLCSHFLLTNLGQVEFCSLSQQSRGNDGNPTMAFVNEMVELLPFQCTITKIVL